MSFWQFYFQKKSVRDYFIDAKFHQPAPHLAFVSSKIWNAL